MKTHQKESEKMLQNYHHDDHLDADSLMTCGIILELRLTRRLLL